MSGMNPLARRAPRLASALLGTSLAATPACAAPAGAATLSVTLAELDAVLDTLDEGAADDGTGSAALRALVVRRLDDAPSDAHVGLDAGSPLYEGNGRGTGPITGGRIGPWPLALLLMVVGVRRERGSGRGSGHGSARTSRPGFGSDRSAPTMEHGQPVTRA